MIVPDSKNGLRSGDNAKADLVSDRQLPMWTFSNRTINSSNALRADATSEYACASQPRQRFVAVRSDWFVIKQHFSMRCESLATGLKHVAIGQPNLAERQFVAR